MSGFIYDIDRFMTDAELYRAAGITDRSTVEAAKLRQVASFAIERYIAIEQLPNTEQQLERALEALKALNHPRT